MSEKNFILVTRDGERPNGGKVPALEVIRARLVKNRWPIYENTRGRKSFEVGNEVAFYIGGLSESSGFIVAKARIRKISKAISYNFEDEDILEEPPFLFLEFTDISHLKMPIKFRDKLESLSICPKNLQKWGVILIGGCRQVGKDDWRVIFS